MFGARKCWVPVCLWTLSCVFLSALIIDFRQVFFDKCMSEWVSEYIWSCELRWEVTVLTSYKLKAWGLYSPCPEPKELEYLIFLICRITMIWENPANQQPWFQRYSQSPRCLLFFSCCPHRKSPSRLGLFEVDPCCLARRGINWDDSCQKRG